MPQVGHEHQARSRPAACAAVCGAAASAHAQFSGPYAPPNWTFNSNGGSGSVYTASAPVSISLTGNDNGMIAINTDYTIAAAASGAWSFDWEYITTDKGTFDSAYHLINGVQSLLAYNSSPAHSGSAVISSASAYSPQTGLSARRHSSLPTSLRRCPAQLESLRCSDPASGSDVIGFASGLSTVRSASWLSKSPTSARPCRGPAAS